MSRCYSHGQCLTSPPFLNMALFSEPKLNPSYSGLNCRLTRSNCFGYSRFFHDQIVKIVHMAKM